MLNPCVLIPSYNEARTIGGIVKALKARGLKSYVVDDGSTDGTGAIAEAEGAVVISHQRNKGKGASIRDGCARILRDGFGALIIMDGDGQHRIEDIGRFLKKAEEPGASMVIGNRMGDISSMPYIRILVNRFMSWAISRISGQAVQDTQCGFRLIKAEVLEAMKLESSNYEIESEMIIAAAKKGYKIESVPIETVYKNEMSRINPFFDTIRFFLLLIKISTRR